MCFFRKSLLVLSRAELEYSESSRTISRIWQTKEGEEREKGWKEKERRMKGRGRRRR
jgi:hypothetical protein